MINIYYQEIKKFSSLTIEEEQKLLISIKHGDQQARKRLIESNLRLVTNIARQYHRPNVELLDLIQEGNLGLIEAVDKFDCEMGYRFSTFAVWRIRISILKFLGEDNKIVSLDTPIKEDGNHLFLSDTIEDKETILGSPSCSRIEMEEPKDLHNQLTTLPPREREVITLLYGIGIKRSWSLREIANKLGLSHERVRCIKNRAIKRLR